MTKFLRSLTLASAMITVSMFLTVPADAAAKQEPSPARPVPVEAFAAIPYAPCRAGGPTAEDAAIADQVRPFMNGSRLRSAVDAYNISCARTITEVVVGRGMDKRAAVIAATTAITESTLHNYTQAVDYDSLGLFQQRPSQGWGTPAQLIDPIYATNAFLDAMVRKFPSNSWMTGDIGAICQRVQVSAFPDAYAREVHDAQLIVDKFWPSQSSGGVSAGQAVVHEGYTSVFTVNAADGHLQESFLARLGGAWVTQDLSVVAGTPSVAGQPIAVVHDGYTSVFTVNASNGRLQETFLARVGGAWVTQDLGAVAVGQTPSVSVHDGFVSVFTVTSAGQIQETYLSRLGAAWVTQPLPGGVVAPYTSVVTHDGYVSVFAVTTGGRVQETFLASIGVAWVSQDLGVAAVAQAPSVVTHDGYVSVFTVTAAGQLQETYLARMGAAWVTQSLPGSAVKPATSAVVHDGYVSVFAATTGGRLQETFLSGLGTAWVAQDLTADPGTPLMAGRPVTVTHDGYTSVFTINATGGHVQETYLPRIGAAWITQDLTTTAGTPAAKP
ncbi:PLL family lectin [Micromonospora sp. AKA38]|uniref:hypothetical protein n=2 Tax=unclassified Micromonospora TaxID=2617518 RepID=UPI0022BBE3BB|nr:hypothetical protein [Micromonospora sp. AKA38]GHJ15308.1 hypothetical protein TPA0908_33030 [Micromonospora sp. AKA38]